MEVRRAKHGRLEENCGIFGKKVHLESLYGYTF